MKAKYQEKVEKLDNVDAPMYGLILKVVFEKLVMKYVQKKGSRNHVDTWWRNDEVKEAM